MAFLLLVVILSLILKDLKCYFLQPGLLLQCHVGIGMAESVLKMDQSR